MPDQQKALVDDDATIDESPVGEMSPYLAPQPDLWPLLDLSDVLSELDNQRRRYPVVRVLTLAEVEQYIEPVFSQHGALLPKWTSSFFVGAVDMDGTVLGWITVQSVVHVEPMYVVEGHAALMPRIVAGATEEIERVLGQVKVYLTAEDDRVVRLAERMGMQREPGVAMTKWIGPDVVEIAEATEGDTE